MTRASSEYLLSAMAIESAYGRLCLADNRKVNQRM